LFWSLFFLLYAWTFFTRLDNSGYNATLFNILTFTIGSKGFASFMVWIFVTDVGTRQQTTEEEGIDANKALREEVLSLATAGIRSSAKDGANLTIDATLTVRRPITVAQTHKEKSFINPYFFIRFMLGETEEIRKVREMVSSKRRSINSSFTRSSLPDPANSSFIGYDNANRPSETNRLSQRPTVLSGTEAINKLTLGNAPAGVARESNDLENGNGNGIGTAGPISNIITAKRSVSEFTRQSDLMEPVNPDAVNTNGALVHYNNSLTSYLYGLALKVLDIDQPDSVEFKEFEPFHFRRVRISCGVTDDIYIK
jgi:hypothetical protein